MFKSHKVVNHGAYQYVDEDKTTNTIEAFWSFLKRGLTGTYHNVIHKLIHRYCSEFKYRWNMRKKSAEKCFENLIDRCFGRKITWDILTSPLLKY